MCSRLCVQLNTAELIEMESRLVVVGGWGAEEMGRHTCSYEMSKFWGFGAQHGDYH